MNNLSNTNFNILDLNKIEINSLYISKCKFGSNLNLLKCTNETKIQKFNICESNFVSTHNIDFKQCVKLSLNDCFITTTENINLSATYIFINNGLWNFENLYIQNDTDMIKVSCEDAELHGKKFEIVGNTDVDASFFDTNSAFDLDTLNISGFAPTFNKTKFHCPNITLTSAENVNLIESFFFLNEKNLNLNINSSICGKCVIAKSNSKNEFNLNSNM